MFTITPAKKTQLEPLAKIFDQYRSFYNMPANLNSSRNFIKQRLEKSDSLLFVAEKDKQLAGFMQIYPSFSSVAMKPIWILNDLFVAKKARRLGCARKMMKYLQATATRQDIFSIKLATEVNNFKAKDLYLSLGYELNQGFEHYSKRLVANGQ